jgi:hypothetical protein
LFVGRSLADSCCMFLYDFDSRTVDHAEEVSERRKERVTWTPPVEFVTGRGIVGSDYASREVPPHCRMLHLVK